MTLRVLHLADLHAGKITARRLNRNEDLKFALDQVSDFIASEGADYLIVAGDVFDKPLPDAESERLIYEFLVKTAAAGTKVIVIAGNHDSPKKLKSIVPWGRRLGVEVFTEPRPDRLIYRDERIAIACVPFVYERAITTLEGGSEEAKIDYGKKVTALLKRLAQSVADAPHRLLTAHLFFENAKLGHSEREITVSKAYAVPQSAIPETFHYAALGHVHRYQRLEGAPTEAYYTGSLYQLDFGEAEERKFFNFVLLEGGRLKAVERVEVKPLRVLKKIVISSLEDLLKLKPRPDAYYWIVVKAETPQEFLLVRDRAEKLLKDRLLKITALYGKAVGEHKKERKSSNLRDPIAMYELYLRERGKRLSNEARNLLKRLLGED